MRSALFFGLVLASSTLLADATSQTRIVLTNVENGWQSQKNFQCQGTIHGYLALEKAYRGFHQLEGIWRGPGGTVLEQSKTLVDCRPERQTVYVALTFGEETGKILDSISRTGDNSAFNGPWNLEVRWDGQVVLKEDFDVQCPS